MPRITKNSEELLGKIKIESDIQIAEDADADLYKCQYLLALVQTD